MDPRDILVMTQQELKRLELIKKVMARHLRQVEAAGLLGISVRQVKRLAKKVKEGGNKAIVHGLRGKANCRRFGEEFKAKVLEAYVRRYKGFAASLACEKLAQDKKIFVNRETLRRWLLESGYIIQRRLRRKHRLWRERRAYAGEMVQMDGSHHDWLEGRGPRLVLMGYIDDATNRVFARFYEYEGTIPAMDSFKRYVRRYGLPQSVYLDRHTTYKSTLAEQWKAQTLGQGDGLSAFERALKQLDVRVIHANSPQAKGRVERLFRTLQDRLVKELRLANALNIEQANKLLVKYLIEHNRRFTLTPAKTTDLHRPAPKGKQLDDILCIKTQRALRNDFTLAHNKRFYQVLGFTRAKNLEVREHINGHMEIIAPDQSKVAFKQLVHRPSVEKPRFAGCTTRRDRIRRIIGV